MIVPPCPPPLEHSHEVVVLPIDETTAVVASTLEQPGYVISAGYDRIREPKRWAEIGEVEATNVGARARVVRYRQTRRVPPGLRPWLDESSPLCYDQAESLVVLEIALELEVDGSATAPIEWDFELGALADLDQDGKVDGSDRGLLFADWGEADSPADLNRDGTVDGEDFGLLLEAWTG